jgi:hypothetical protein
MKTRWKIFRRKIQEHRRHRLVPAPALPSPTLRNYRGHRELASCCLGVLCVLVVQSARSASFQLATVPGSSPQVCSLDIINWHLTSNGFALLVDFSGGFPTCTTASGGLRVVMERTYDDARRGPDKCAWQIVQPINRSALDTVPLNCWREWLEFAEPGRTQAFYRARAITR